jgi:hypothetical protein
MSIISRDLFGLTALKNWSLDLKITSLPVLNRILLFENAEEFKQL